MPMATNMWLPHPRAFGCDGSTPGGVQPGTGLKPPDVVCWDAEVVGMCDRKDLEALSPLRHFGNGNRKRNGKETGLAPSHTILHVKFTVYDYTQIYIYIECSQDPLWEKQFQKPTKHSYIVLKIVWNCWKIVWKLFSLKTILWKLFKYCFYQKDMSKQFYENCLNMFFIQNMFRSILRKLFKHCFFIKKSLKTILWKLFKHSFYQQDLWNNFMNIV